MTYRTDCGGEKFFRNADAVCGEFAEAESCACGPTHNTHQKLTSVFGAQEPITAAPTSMITLPIAGGALGAVVGVQAGSQRGVAKVELLVNGFEWAEVKGGPYGVNGQANPGTYTILVPTNLPDGVVDLVARACDDIGACTESAVVTATKGAPCTSADTCAQGQHCDAGKCLWDPGSGQVGDGCAFDPMCASGMCSPTVDDRICTQTCGAEAACPEGLACLDTQAGSFCYFPQDAGCCSAGTGASAGYAQLGLGALVIGLVARRRRRR
jgi:MYXO-CTERM domain-containing protein